MLIDNVFTDTSKLDNYTILPVYNGLLDHDGQLSSLNQQPFCCKKKKQTNHNAKTIRKFSKSPLDKFKLRLSFEIWQHVFNVKNNNNRDSIFNTFLNTCLEIFHDFYKKRKCEKSPTKYWITIRIKISCKKRKCTS
jgi:hypothetical protein